MRQPFNQATPVPPTTEDINRIWRTDRCLQESTAKVYLQWIRRFRAYLVLLARLDEGYDAVLGLRAKRKDHFFLRKVPSLLGNWLIRKVTGVPIMDMGCTLRAMRRDLAAAGVVERRWWLASGAQRLQKVSV